MIQIASLLTTLLNGFSIAGTYEEALEAYQRRDYQNAFRLYTILVEQGDARAQNDIGVLYDSGRGVPQDCAEAVRWFRKAAEQGPASAQYNLGILYGKGQGVQRDYVLSYMWSSLAASSQSDAAKRRKAVNNRDIAASKMTPAQITEAQRLAREWQPKKER